MKRLFALKEQNDELFQAIPKAIGPLCFETKRDAKERRDEVNEFRHNDDKLCVTYGPDHDRFNER